MANRIEQVCLWIAIICFILLHYLLFVLLRQFPRIYYDNGDVIFSAAWIPIGYVSVWLKIKLEDWLMGRDLARQRLDPHS
ncbi:MAG TPA: hypothetical protein DCX52_13950 [Massilia sp.]|nr:hypothetical protein [Massilia sp.]